MEIGISQKSIFIWAKAQFSQSMTNPRLKPGVSEFLMSPGFSPRHFQNV